MSGRLISSRERRKYSHRAAARLEVVKTERAREQQLASILGNIVVPKDKKAMSGTMKSLRKKEVNPSGREAFEKLVRVMEPVPAAPRTPSDGTMRGSSSTSALPPLSSTGGAKSRKTRRRGGASRGHTLGQSQSTSALGGSGRLGRTQPYAPVPEPKNLDGYSPDKKRRPAYRKSGRMLPTLRRPLALKLAANAPQAPEIDPAAEAGSPMGPPRQRPTSRSGYRRRKKKPRSRPSSRGSSRKVDPTPGPEVDEARTRKRPSSRPSSNRRGSGRKLLEADQSELLAAQAAASAGASRAELQLLRAGSKHGAFGSHKLVKIKATGELHTDGWRLEVRVHDPVTLSEKVAHLTFDEAAGACMGTGVLVSALNSKSLADIDLPAFLEDVFGEEASAFDAGGNPGEFSGLKVQYDQADAGAGVDTTAGSSKVDPMDVPAGVVLQVGSADVKVDAGPDGMERVSRHAIVSVEGTFGTEGWRMSIRLQQGGGSRAEDLLFLTQDDAAAAVMGHGTLCRMLLNKSMDAEDVQMLVDEASAKAASRAASSGGNPTIATGAGASGLFADIGNYVLRAIPDERDIESEDWTLRVEMTPKAGGGVVATNLSYGDAAGAVFGYGALARMLGSKALDPATARLLAEAAFEDVELGEDPAVAAAKAKAAAPAAAAGNGRRKTAAQRRGSRAAVGEVFAQGGRKLNGRYFMVTTYPDGGADGAGGSGAVVSELYDPRAQEHHLVAASREDIAWILFDNAEADASVDATTSFLKEVQRMLVVPNPFLEADEDESAGVVHNERDPATSYTALSAVHPVVYARKVLRKSFKVERGDANVPVDITASVVVVPGKFSSSVQRPRKASVQTENKRMAEARAAAERAAAWEPAAGMRASDCGAFVYLQGVDGDGKTSAVGIAMHSVAPFDEGRDSVPSLVEATCSKLEWAEGGSLQLAL